MQGYTGKRTFIFQYRILKWKYYKLCDIFIAGRDIFIVKRDIKK